MPTRTLIHQHYHPNLSGSGSEVALLKAGQVRVTWLMLWLHGGNDKQGAYHVTRVLRLLPDSTETNDTGGLVAAVRPFHRLHDSHDGTCRQDPHHVATRGIELADLALSLSRRPRTAMCEGCHNGVSPGQDRGSCCKLLQVKHLLTKDMARFARVMYRLPVTDSHATSTCHHSNIVWI